MTAPTDLKTLAVLHAAAKQNEAIARQERQAIEDQIVALIGLKEHGQKTVDRDGAKATVKPNFSYSIDQTAFDAMANTFPQALLPYKVKREPNEARIREIRKNHPDLYRRLATVLTVKPTRPSVDIELTE